MTRRQSLANHVPETPESSGAQEWQRLDSWLWCARFMKSRSACARMVETGFIRLNAQATDKPHARLRVGDVLVIPLGQTPERQTVRVLRVLALAQQRGPAAAARLLYEDIPERPAMTGTECGIPPGSGEN